MGNTEPQHAPQPPEQTPEISLDMNPVQPSLVEVLPSCEKKHPWPKVLAVMFAAFAVALIGVVMFVQSLPLNVTLNGRETSISGSKTLASVLDISNPAPNPGNLVAVDGSVLEPGKGKPFRAFINGAPVDELAHKIHAGDMIELGDGDHVEEAADTTSESIPWVVEGAGSGAIHLLEGVGKNGEAVLKTGKQSGLSVKQVTHEPTNTVRRNVTPEVGEDKVIALTFDDGPWSEQTGELMDVLAEQAATATFFTVGNRIERDGGAHYMKRAMAEGHQISTHTYSHASGSGQSVNLGYMTPEEQVTEVEKGRAAIEAATGFPANRILRAPGGNFDADVARNLSSYITAEIGWDIDSGDWRKSGEEGIADKILGAWPGAIILCHDGGGDRSQTIEALKIALPRLKEQGYRFITIDELMKYPLA